MEILIFTKLDAFFIWTDWEMVQLLSSVKDLPISLSDHLLLSFGHWCFSLLDVIQAQGIRRCYCNPLAYSSLYGAATARLSIKLQSIDNMMRTSRQRHSVCANKDEDAPLLFGSSGIEHFYVFSFIVFFIFIFNFFFSTMSDVFLKQNFILPVKEVPMYCY